MKRPRAANLAVEMVVLIRSSFVNEVSRAGGRMPLCRLDRNRKDNFDSVTRGTTAETEQRNTNSQVFFESWRGSCQERGNQLWSMQDGPIPNGKGGVLITCRYVWRNSSKADQSDSAWVGPTIVLPKSRSWCGCPPIPRQADINSQNLEKLSNFGI